MITLRKDVRLGLMIGGILLAVSGVYLMLSMVGSKPETATLDDGTNTTGIDIAKAAPAKTETKPTIVANNKKPADQPKQAEPKNPVAPAANEDLWSIAFNNGEVKSNITRTENPLTRPTDPKSAPRRPVAARARPGNEPPRCCRTAPGAAAPAAVPVASRRSPAVPASITASEPRSPSASRCT